VCRQTFLHPIRVRVRVRVGVRVRVRVRVMVRVMVRVRVRVMVRVRVRVRVRVGVRVGIRDRECAVRLSYTSLVDDRHAVLGVTYRFLEAVIPSREAGPRRCSIGGKGHLCNERRCRWTLLTVYCDLTWMGLIRRLILTTRRSRVEAIIYLDFCVPSI